MAEASYHRRRIAAGNWWEAPVSSVTNIGTIGWISIDPAGTHLYAWEYGNEFVHRININGNNLSLAYSSARVAFNNMNDMHIAHSGSYVYVGKSSWKGYYLIDTGSALGSITSDNVIGRYAGWYVPSVTSEMVAGISSSTTIRTVAGNSSTDYSTPTYNCSVGAGGNAYENDFFAVRTWSGRAQVFKRSTGWSLVYTLTGLTDPQAGGFLSRWNPDATKLVSTWSRYAPLRGYSWNGSVLSQDWTTANGHSAPIAVTTDYIVCHDGEIYNLSDASAFGTLSGYSGTLRYGDRLGSSQIFIATDNGVYLYAL